MKKKLGIAEWRKQGLPAAHHYRTSSSSPPPPFFSPPPSPFFSPIVLPPLFLGKGGVVSAPFFTKQTNGPASLLLLLPCVPCGSPLKVTTFWTKYLSTSKKMNTNYVVNGKKCFFPNFSGKCFFFPQDSATFPSFLPGQCSPSSSRYTRDAIFFSSLLL